MPGQFPEAKKSNQLSFCKTLQIHNKSRDLKITAGEMSDNLRNTVNGLAYMGVCRFPKQTARFKHLFKNRVVETSYTLCIVNSIIFKVRKKKKKLYIFRSFPSLVFNAFL